MPLRLLSAAVAQGSEHENSTDEGSIAKYTFAADELQVGKTYLITGSAIVNDSNGSDTLTLALRFGSSTTVTSNTAVVASAAIDSADNDVAAFTCFMTVRSIGSSGSVVLHGFFAQADAEAVGTTPAFAFHQVVSSLNTEAALYLDYTADWSAAHADNEVAADSFVVCEIV